MMTNQDLRLAFEIGCRIINQNDPQTVFRKFCFFEYMKSREHVIWLTFFPDFNGNKNAIHPEDIEKFNNYKNQ